MKKRVISAIVLVAIFLPFLIMGGLYFAIFVTALGTMALYELMKVYESKKKIPFLLKLIAYAFVIYFCLYNTGTVGFDSHLDYRAMIMPVLIFLMSMVFIHDYDTYNFSDAIFLIGSVLFIGLSFNLIIIVRNYKDLSYLIYLVLTTTITDTFALFTGSLVGEHPLCPTISPKKTIEGFIGGVLMGTFVASSFYNVVINNHISLVLVIMVTMALCVVGQIGDLVFSSIKRYYGVKDFSNLIPGHGGVLDRFDSLVFVTLAFVLLLGIL